MANSPRESAVVNAILRYVNTIPNSKWEKTHGGLYGKAGKPDITGCIRGRRVEIEAKTDTGKLHPLQERELNEWRLAGAVSFVARSADEVKERLQSEGLA